MRGKSVERDRLRENKKREGYERKSYESKKKREERCQSSDVRERDTLRDISQDRSRQRYIERC
jgi:hypothetical protein